MNKDDREITVESERGILRKKVREKEDEKD